jgi:SAM-dependent methyltransferase
MPPRPLIDTCPIGCASSLTPTHLVLPEGPLRRCSACGQLVSQADAARYESSMLEFDDPRGTAPDPRAAARREQLAHRRVRAVAAELGVPTEGLALLDVGCSSGAFLASARKLGCRVQGVEPAARAAASARAQGIDVFNGTLEAARFPDARFDAATLFEVIEHLVAPVDLLREICRVLRPGGVLLVGTGNADSWTVRQLGGHWDYFSIDRHGGHISFFNPGSMRLAAQRAGFETIRIETRNVNLQEGYRRRSLRHRAAKLLGQALNLPARSAQRGHDMLAFLRKPAAR